MGNPLVSIKLTNHMYTIIGNKIGAAKALVFAIIKSTPPIIYAIAIMGINHANSTLAEKSLAGSAAWTFN
jgi:hypothetical protein